jgi:hypothetical protein
MDMDYEKLGIGLAVIVVFFFLATRLPPMLMGGAAKMMGAGRRSNAAADEPQSSPAPRAAGKSDVAGRSEVPGFAREAVDAVEGDWEEISKVNALVAQLEARKQRVVAREGALLRSKVAWKIAAFEQAALQRTTALAAGSVRLWNLRSVAGAVLCSRSVIECAAVLLDAERELGRLAEAGDLAGIDALVMRLGFGGAAGPADLPGLIDACDRQAPGTRARYDILAGLSDAGSLGQVGLAGDLDKSGTAVTFSDTAMFERGLLNQVAGGLQALAVAETALAGIDALIPRVVELDNA